MVTTKLDERDFYFRPYAAMFRAIGTMHASQLPVNSQTVIRKLGETRSTQRGPSALDEMGGADVVVATLDGTAPEDVEFWVNAVRKKRQERDLLTFATEARRAAMSNPADIAKVLSSLEEKLTNVSGDGAERHVYTLQESMEGLGPRIKRYIDDPDSITGLATGWGIFDRYLDGLQLGNVSIVYAPTSRFKSMFVANIGWLLARQDIPGLWFTTEMPHHQVSERLLQLELGMNFRWMRRDRTIGKYEQEITRAQGYTERYPVYIDDSSDLDIGTLRATVAQQKKWNDIQYVIVDLLDFVTSSSFKEDSVSQQSLIMRHMKDMAKKNNIHVILVSHVAKGDRALRGKPDLDVDDMKGSSSKGQDVDYAISLMPVSWDGEKGQWRGLDRDGITYKVDNGGTMTVLVSITKNRHGEIGKLPFVIDLNRGGRMYPDIKPPRQVQLDENDG